MKDTIEITITREDAEKAGSYADIKGCLLCQVLKRMFPENTFLSVGGNTFSLRVNGCMLNYDFMQAARKIQAQYPIDLKNFQSFTFTATKVWCC